MPKFTTVVQLDGATVQFESERTDDVLTTIALLRNERQKAVVSEAIADAEQKRVDSDPPVGTPKLTLENGGAAPKTRKKRTDQTKGAGAVTVVDTLPTGALEVVAPLAATIAEMTQAEAEQPTISLQQVRDALMGLARFKGAPAAMDMMTRFTGPTGQPAKRADEIRSEDYRTLVDLVAKEMPQ